MCTQACSLNPEYCLKRESKASEGCQCFISSLLPFFPFGLHMQTEMVISQCQQGRQIQKLLENSCACELPPFGYITPVHLSVSFILQKRKFTQKNIISLSFPSLFCCCSEHKRVKAGQFCRGLSMLISYSMVYNRSGKYSSSLLLMYLLSQLCLSLILILPVNCFMFMF